MYFCPNCSYSFDITKSSKTSKESDDRKTISKAIDVFKKIDLKEELSMYKASFNKDELLKNKRYQKLSDSDKIFIDQIFEEKVESGAEFKCNNCNNTEQISNTVLLYQVNNETSYVKIKTLEENEYITKDPLLPRTHDYNCKNPNCITHKKKDIKEAVFYREKDSYKILYICTVCFVGW